MLLSDLQTPSPCFQTWRCRLGRISKVTETQTEAESNQQIVANVPSIHAVHDQQKHLLSSGRAIEDCYSKLEWATAQNDVIFSGELQNFIALPRQRTSYQQTPPQLGEHVYLCPPRAQPGWEGRLWQIPAEYWWVMSCEAVTIAFLFRQP